MRVYENVPLASWTSLRVGGSAARVVAVDREDEVGDAVRTSAEGAGTLVVLGDGTNVIVGDGGLSGTVLRVDIRGVDVQRDGDRVLVDVGAGEPWDGFVEFVVGERWRGIESLSGIPGRTGATPIQNVGAYGWEVGETIATVRAFDRIEKVLIDIPAQDCHFGYRASLFKQTDRYIVTRVSFVLDAGTQSSVRYAELARALGVAQGGSAPVAGVRAAVLGLRREKGMLVDPSDPESASAGSFFMNPVVDGATLSRVAARAGEAPSYFKVDGGRYKLAAAWLVERSGFAKGWQKGRVGVSRKHSLALVNRGGATASEIVAVARQIRDGVRSRFGVELEPEPVFLGCSWNAP